MDDAVPLRTWTSGRGAPIVMINGGPGLPDYLAPVAELVEHLGTVHRYDQRGTGGSAWDGEHTFGLHVADLGRLLDAWGHRRAVVVGHSYGTELALRFVLAHPERVAGLVLVAGPFLGQWRSVQLRRLTGDQQARLDELDSLAGRTEAEETEYLTLSWVTDHADQERAWEWASDAARRVRPVNYAMNRQLNAAGRADPLVSRLDEMRLPAATVIIGGGGDSRPAEGLRQLGERLGRPVVIIEEAGHSPWLEAPSRFRRELEQALDLGLAAARDVRP
ncbi:alpha/beta hydrolase [Actinoplanes sp. Pm04-4]|uniref:Alpha/beta hydrolase n=1 Tax=Paractinoplanes pyxinae TaxID=2997416 RepID=A0ABT4BGA2_9ACTN|nr:alpha/beta hydrolase [Actinoplanes pyxinae]MCY1145569.1 alpha/beta hydrolase [Actinoplanes pyxinae]